MGVSSRIASDTDVGAFIDEYFKLGKEPTKLGFSLATPKPCRWRFRAQLLMERRRSGKVAGLWGVRIRPGPSTDHSRPYLFRRNDITQTDFITPASGAAESLDFVVRFARQSKSTDRSVIRARRS